MRWAVVAALGVGLARATSPPLSISLETSWPAPPILLEILETVYDENPPAYFPLLHLVSTHLPAWQDETDASLLSSALDLIETYSILRSPGSLSTFHFALGLHTAAPRIEAFYSWYENSVDEEALGVEACGAWVEWKGKGFCSVGDLKRDIELSIEDGIHHWDGLATSLPFDHVSPALNPVPNAPHAVIYWDPTSPSSHSLLDYLEHQAARTGTFQYVVRYRPPSHSTNSDQDDAQRARRTALSGYGVEMALKKTDYLVVDDRVVPGASSEGVTGQVSATKGTTAGPFAAVLGDDPWAELSTPLSPLELANVSLKTSALIMASEKPLDALQHLSQNFPRYSAALARKVDLPDAIKRRGMKIASRGQTAPTMFINGKAFTGNELNAFSLLKHLRDERHHVLSLTSLGLTPRQAFELVSDAVIGQAQTEDDPGEGIVDASDRIEGGGVITWWNDIEKDKKYKGWPIHLQGLLRPLYPGQFHTVRRNIYNLVFVLDYSLVSSLDTIAGAVGTMIQRGVPLRFGVVPMFSDEDDLSFKLARIFEYSIKTFGRALTKEMMAEIVQRTPSTPSSPGVVTLDTARKVYERISGESTKASLPFDEVLKGPVDEQWLDNIQHYTARLLATKEESALGHLFINGKHTVPAGAWTAVVQNEIGAQLNHLQEQLAMGYVPEDVSTFFYDLPGVPSRRSKLIVPGTQESKLRVFNVQDVFADDITGRLGSEFVYTDDESRGAPISMWVVGDLDSPEGLETVADALSHLQTPHCSSRLGFVHVPSSTDTTTYRLSTMLYHLLSAGSLSSTTARDLSSLVQELQAAHAEEEQAIRADRVQVAFEASPLHALTSAGWEVADTAAAGRFWEAGAKVARKLGLRDGQPHLLVNGRLVGPIDRSAFPLEDFDALELYEHRKRVKPVIDLLKTMYDDISVFDRATLANLISTVSSVVASAYAPSDSEGIFTPTQSPRARFYEKLDDGMLSFHIGDSDTALLHVAAVMDPVSEQAQMWSALLKALSDMEHVAISVYLEPDPTVTEIKLKRFYRFSLAPKLNFDVDGNEIAPGVTFTDLPSTPIYTLGMDTPPAWIVSPRTSPYDLDNLVLSHIHQPVNVLFTLKQLLIEGHAREGNNAPPRGLQLQLTKNGLEVASDTLVMANLGYLQFKVTPGVYDLNIRPGRGQQVYELESVGNEGWNSAEVEETGTAVSLTSFEGTTILPRFRRKDGMERADVLAEDEADTHESVVGQVFSKMKSLVGLNPVETKPAKSRHADINIFTVASGLLYERFASIMILSVLKHTEHSVKFWFIENFLSPTFLAFIPKMAEEYGFQYEFVTYKFPGWLRAQTEKQRVIWAYKILFLDVLFPLDLDKVIFVDADQIVRTDMKELVDVDLHTRVYGYAPMGDSRTEMEGFRFWKSGYWKEALRGRPYHISALYVVDLKRFRQVAAGDRLRGQYHALSADPNSLANLDQDLPNSMQDQIPIWTLDQDWLYCQTWCNDESLATAKTIDLCQNPLTKEPKLVRARQIPEWDVYDQEIAAFAKRLEAESGGGIGAGALAASVDDLAGVKAEAAEPADEKMDDAGVEVDEEARGGRRIEDEL